MPLKRDDEDRESLASRAGRGAAALGGAVGIGALVDPFGRNVGNRLNALAYDKHRALRASGYDKTVLSPEQIADIEKKMKLSPKVQHYDLETNGAQMYRNRNFLAWNREGKVTGFTPEGIQHIQPVNVEAAARKAAGNPMTREEVSRRVSEELAKHHSEGAILSNKATLGHLHEAGHATGLMHVPENAGKLRKAVSNYWTRGQALGGRALGLDAEYMRSSPRMAKFVRAFPGVAAAARQAHKEMTGDDSLALRGADYAGKGAIAMKLLEEGQASAKPLYHIFKDHGLKTGLKAGKMYGTSFLTYAAPAIGTQIIAPLAVKAGFKLDRWLNKKRNGDRDDAREG